MRDNLRSVWENRALLFGDKKEAVMQQSFPSVVNNYIHGLHMKEVLRFLPKAPCECLDIGCGYGRVASEIVKENKHAKVFGVDISSVFVKLFNKKLGESGKAYEGDIRKLPFVNEKFHIVVCIVTLMYMDTESDQRKGISEMLRVLKRNGKIILIEPNKTGDNIIKLFGLLPFILRKVLKKKKVETYGTAFPWGRIQSLVEASGGRVTEKRGYPFLTISLIPILVLSKISKHLASIFLKIVYLLDNLFPFPRFSHTVTYIIEKS